MERAAEGWTATGAPATPRPRSSIRTRIVRTAVALALIPLAVLGATVLVSLQRLSTAAGSSVDESRAALSTQVVTRGLEEASQELGDQLDRYLIERVRDVKVWAGDPLIRSAAQAGTQEADRQGLRARSPEELENRFRAGPALGNPAASDYLSAQLAGSGGAFAEMFFTDAYGHNVAYSSKTSDFVQSDESWWQDAWAKGLDVGPIAYDDSARTFSSEIAVRINDGSASGVGVFKAVLNLGMIQSIADARSPRHNVTLINEDGLLLAETVTRHDPARIMNPAVVFPAVVEREVAPVVDVARGRGVGSVITRDRAWGAARTGRTQMPVDNFTGFNWVVLIDEPTDAAFAPLSSVDAVRRSIDDVANLLRLVVILAVILVSVVAVAVSRPLAQRIVRPILRLRDEADDVATTRLPRLVDSVDQLRPGEELPTLEPIALRTGDEVEELADKFNSVVATASRLATEQVENRRHNLSATFISMGRRNQRLLGRQLQVLDELERHESDPDSLEGLFKLDQLATRMRRNAESLLVLAGQPPTRKWTQRVPMQDVVRAAVSEIEEFPRIEATSIEPAYLRGDVLAEVAHLLAELCENATAFSPPDTPVEVIGRVRGPGYRISIVDKGIGMSAEELAQANEKLKHPDGFDRVPSQYLGLFVVGRLAARLGIEVHLFESAAEGLIARVTLPPTLLDLGRDTPGNAAADGPAAVPAPSAGEPQPEPAPDPVGPLVVAVERDTSVRFRSEPVPAEPVGSGEPAPEAVPPVPAAPGPIRLDGSPVPVPPAAPVEPVEPVETVETVETVAPAAPAVPSPDGLSLPARRRRQDESIGPGSRRLARIAPSMGTPDVVTDAVRFTRAKRPTDWVDAADAHDSPGAPAEFTASGFRVRQRRVTPAAPPAPAGPTPLPSVAPVAPAAPPAEAAEQARSTLSNFMTGVERGRREALEEEDE